MSQIDEVLITEVVELLQVQEPDYKLIADKIYHAGKSLGVSYIKIRSKLSELPYPYRLVASRHFINVIDYLNSPNLFIDSID
ncbi:MAG: hypothetical protein VXX85_07000 [Candidatus Margulisiibacteriota bacterium]|nr:hypothetical protein [Candidatus Margulisiibacteriota bacterium]